MKKFKTGEVIFTEGKEGTHAYILKTGKVKITKTIRDTTPRTIATVGQGNIIGEMALIDDAPRAGSAVALEATEAMVITRDEFQQRLDKSDQVISLLLKIYAERLRQQTKNVADHMN